MSHGMHCVGCGVWVTDGWSIPHDCPKTLTEAAKKALHEVFERKHAEIENRLGLPVIATSTLPPGIDAMFVQGGKVVGVIKNSGAPQEGA